MISQEEIKYFSAATYDNNKYHFAVTVDDFEAAQKLHEEMGCIQRKVPNKELHFITDPDGNLIEVLSEVQAAK